MIAGWIAPDWPAPAVVGAISTTRSGGFSTGRHLGLNLGSNCGDDPGSVERNRAVLRQFLPGDPFWLQQVHGVEVVRHPDHASTPAMPEAGDSIPRADAQVTGRPGQVCAILTADCLPVLFCNRAGTRVAAAHAGWRGLAAGVLEQTVKSMEEAPGELLAWMGPAIGPGVYQVGEDVRDEFLRRDAAADSAFRPHGDRWLLDLYAAARGRLARSGVTSVFGGGWCTYSDPERFYSHRRDGVTGRMASLVWLRQDSPL